jgi:hypothetical protein
VDPIELLFEFYDVYLLLKKQTSHLNCLPIGPKHLQDFNEIDRYLLDPSYVLSYLKDIEDIKKWGIEVEIKHN